jgi:basic amino acid/polyamine antiporter, APA family
LSGERDSGMRFRRVIGRNTLLAMGFGSMIGFGWVVLAGGWVVEAGSLGAILAFLVGGLAVGFIGLTYAELMCAMPKVGGEHHYAWRAIGTKGAFVTSWAIALGYISVVMFESVALPTAVGFIAPGYEAGYLWTIAGYEVRLTWVLVGVVAAVAVTALNYVGIRPAAIFQLIAALFLVGVGALLLFGTVTNGSAQNFTPLIAAGAAGILAVVIQTPFLFVGFDVIPQSAEEIDLPVRKIGIYLLVAIVMATAWYILIVVGVSSSLGQRALESSGSPTADALGALFGGGFFADVIILGGVAGILTSWNALLVGGSRILYAMAEHGMLPAWLARLHPRYRTPSNAILLIGGLSLVSPWFGESMLVWLVNAGSLNIVVAYVLVAVSFLVLRRREPDMPRPFKAGGGPYVGLIALVLGLGIAVQYLPGMPAGLSWPAEWIIVLLWWAAGVLFMTRMNAPDYSPEFAGE